MIEIIKINNLYDFLLNKAIFLIKTNDGMSF